MCRLVRPFEKGRRLLLETTCRTMSMVANKLLVRIWALYILDTAQLDNSIFHLLVMKNLILDTFLYVSTICTVL